MVDKGAASITWLSRFERLAKALGAAEARLKLQAEAHEQAIANAVASAVAAQNAKHAAELARSYEKVDAMVESAAAAREGAVAEILELRRALKNAEEANASLLKQNKRLNAGLCHERDENGDRLGYEKGLRDQIERQGEEIRGMVALVGRALDSGLDVPSPEEIYDLIREAVESDTAPMTEEGHRGLAEFCARLTPGERFRAAWAIANGKGLPVELLEALGVAVGLDDQDGLENLEAPPKPQGERRDVGSVTVKVTAEASPTAEQAPILAYERLRSVGAKGLRPQDCAEWTTHECGEAIRWANELTLELARGVEDIPPGWMIEEHPQTHLHRASHGSVPSGMPWRESIPLAKVDARSMARRFVLGDAPDFLRRFFPDAPD